MEPSDPWNFDSMREMLENTQEDLQATFVLLNALDALSGSEGTEEERFNKAIALIRSYGDRRAMNALGGA